MDIEAFHEEEVEVVIPTEEQIAQGYVAPGSTALLSMGISYQASWREPADGMNKHAREQVKALAMTGLPVNLCSFGTTSIFNEDLSEEAKELEYLANVSFTSTAISIKQLVPATPQSMKSMLYPVGMLNYMSELELERLWKSTIVYTSWERDRVHPEYVDLFRRMGQVWVPCKENKEAFVSSGLSPKRVKVIPYPFDPNNCKAAAPRKGLIPLEFGDSEGPKRFYSIGKWEPRKNQHQMIGAFLLAFTPQDKASLFIKTSGFGIFWAGYPTCEQSVGHWLSHKDVQERGWTREHFNRLVKIVDRKLPEEDIRLLHEKNNIYISAGLGEAWDIPAFEAKLSGNRMVFVGYGGPSEYATWEDVKVKWDKKTLVHPGYLWEPDARWAQVSLDSFSKALRDVKPAGYRMVPSNFVRRFSRHAVANLMEAAVKELAIELGCWDILQFSGGFG